MFSWCLTLHHASVSRVSDGVDVRRHFVPLLALVHVNDLLRVDGQVLVRVYHHAEEPGVCLQGGERRRLGRDGKTYISAG